jgi:hypothetical protein
MPRHRSALKCLAKRGTGFSDGLSSTWDLRRHADEAVKDAGVVGVRGCNACFLKTFGVGPSFVAKPSRMTV